MSLIPSRLAALRRQFAALEVEAMVVDSAASRRYLSGFSGSNGAAVITDDAALLVTDSRYYERVQREAPDFELVRAGSAMIEGVVNSLKDLGIRRVGFEAMHVSVHKHRLLRAQSTALEWIATTEVVDRLRAVKDESEIATIRHAAAITDRAMAYAASVIRPGMTERELVWLIEVFMREEGAEGPAFGVIVGGGSNGALPHHNPGPEPVAEGWPVVIDMGARSDGYCADLTRTICLGTPRDPEYESVWSLVHEANLAAVSGIRPGMTCREADAIARDRIDAAGYGDMFGHGLGHGVGLEIHEMPRVGATAEHDVLEPGMVFTIEPGVYLPGRFGVRIEDLAVLREDGVELLSRAPKTPVLSPAELVG